MHKPYRQRRATLLQVGTFKLSIDPFSGFVVVQEYRSTSSPTRMTLIELVIAITVISIAISSVLGVLSATAIRSAEA